MSLLITVKPLSVTVSHLYCFHHKPKVITAEVNEMSRWKYPWWMDPTETGGGRSFFRASPPLVWEECCFLTTKKKNKRQQPTKKKKKTGLRNTSQLALSNIQAAIVKAACEALFCVSIWQNTSSVSLLLMYETEPLPRKQLGNLAK